MLSTIFLGSNHYNHWCSFFFLNSHFLFSDLCLSFYDFYILVLYLNGFIINRSSYRITTLCHNISSTCVENVSSATQNQYILYQPMTSSIQFSTCIILFPYKNMKYKVINITRLMNLLQTLKLPSIYGSHVYYYLCAFN